MCESYTFTTVVSSTTMNVPHITAMAVSQGLTCGASAGCGGAGCSGVTVLAIFYKLRLGPHPHALYALRATP